MDNANGPVEETNSVPFPDNNDTRPNGVFKVTAVFDTPNNDDPRPAIEAIREAVSHRHGVAVSDVRFLPAGAIPRTTSGKLARRACRAQYLSGTLGAH